MRFPMTLTRRMTGYILKNKMSGGKFPLVMMLEPLHACNLTCTGCGRIREYKTTINQFNKVIQYAGENPENKEAQVVAKRARVEQCARRGRQCSAGRHHVVHQQDTPRGRGCRDGRGGRRDGRVGPGRRRRDRGGRWRDGSGGRRWGRSL